MIGWVAPGAVALRGRLPRLPPPVKTPYLVSPAFPVLLVVEKGGSRAREDSRLTGDYRRAQGGGQCGTGTPRKPRILKSGFVGSGASVFWWEAGCEPPNFPRKALSVVWYGDCCTYRCSRSGSSLCETPERRMFGLLGCRRAQVTRCGPPPDGFHEEAPP